ncbi:MAG: hypothetical protein LBS41_01950 [Streptococcaceae bacterium]|nr:hypothetical protein [Streptococcaceae bacterium]
MMRLDKYSGRIQGGLEKLLSRLKALPLWLGVDSALVAVTIILILLPIIFGLTVMSLALYAATFAVYPFLSLFVSLGVMGLVAATVTHFKRKK